MLVVDDGVIVSAAVRAESREKRMTLLEDISRIAERIEKESSGTNKSIEMENLNGIRKMGFYFTNLSGVSTYLYLRNHNA